VKPRRLVVTAVGGALVLLAACSDSSSSDDDATAPDTGADTSAEVASAGLPDFYAVPDPVPDDEPGTLIRTETVDTPELDGTLYRVMYTSRSVQGDPIAVTGVVAVPNTPPPDGGYPVIAWAHGTTGIADECAPSLDAVEAAPIANELLGRGYVVAATDYEGLGTPGRHPYVVGESEARGVLDSVRAAQALPDTEVSDQVLVWGHSQGGHAAMFVLDIADDYAPELDLVGVVAGAPPSQFNLLYQALQASPFKYYLLMAAAGWNAAYGDGDAPLDEVLTPTGIETIDVVDDGCASEIAGTTADIPTDEIVKADPATVPAWAALLTTNDPGQFTNPAATPLLVIHGGNDEQIPVAASALMFDQLCAIGQDQTRWVYPGQTHAGVVPVSVADMLAWIDRRFDGEPTSEVVTPTGQPDVQISSCNTT
jgi:alpha-beta hydrolase superfamily lysophospholipase